MIWIRCLLLAVLWVAGAALGASYPTRAIKVVVPFTASGSADIYAVTRITKVDKIIQNLSQASLTDSLATQSAQLLTAAFDQPVNLERHASERTIAGTLYVARSAPDGYTLLLAGNPTITIYPTLYPNLPFDPLADLIPIAMLARMPIALVAPAQDSMSSVSELIRGRPSAARAHYATLGDDSTSRLAGALLTLESRPKLLVPLNYNGGLAAINAVIKREAVFAIVPLPAALPFARSAKVKLLFLASAQRHSAVPDVQSADEAGFPAFLLEGWFGIFSPTHVPANVVAMLNQQINRGLSEDFFERSLTAQGLLATPLSTEQFTSVVAADSARSRALANALRQEKSY